jgi:hypothetical protein
MSENNTELEDIIEDVTEEQLIANEELEQDLPEVSEEQELSLDDSVKSILLGEKKAVKKEEEDEDEEEEDEEEMDESADSDEEEEEEDEDEVEEKCDSYEKKNVKEALDLLISNEATLSEDFKSEASTLFEAAIAEKSVQINEKLEAKYQVELQEEVETLRESLITKIDNYLGYVVESWIEENSEQVENSLRTEIAENFMTSLKDLFVENYIEVPAEKRDIVEELNNEYSEATDQLTDAEIEIAALKEEVETFKREQIIDALAEDLSESETYRLKAIVEDVEFGDDETFTKKVETIKGSIFESQEQPSQEAETLVESAEEETEIIIEGENGVEKQKLPASMAHYVQALSKKS